MFIIHQIIFMICACNKSRVQIQAVKPKVFDIVKVLTDTVYGSAIIRDRRETVIRIRFSCFADLPFSICETVRKDIINHGIPDPFRNRCQICFVIERVLKKLTALNMRIHFFKTFTCISALYLTVIQQKVISNTFPFSFQNDFVPVI